MNRRARWFTLWLLAPFLTFAGEALPPVVATTTLIETAIHDLTGDAVPVISLLPPGACPGHFDLDPGRIRRMTGAALIFRHDYQSSLDSGLQRAGLDPASIIPLASHPAFTIPSAYIALCEEIAHHLNRTIPATAALTEASLIRLRALAADAEAMRDNDAPWKGRKVLAARFQHHFCTWLGLDVVATFQADMDISARQLAQAVDMAAVNGAELVVGNLQWGPRHLSAIREASGLPGIMFSNFPETGKAGAYWALLENHRTILREAFP